MYYVSHGGSVVSLVTIVRHLNFCMCLCEFPLVAQVSFHSTKTYGFDQPITLNYP